jgi:hypothetical protein
VEMRSETVCSLRVVLILNLVEKSESVSLP